MKKLLEIINEQQINPERIKNGFHFKSMSDSEWKKSLEKTEEMSEKIMILTKKLFNRLKKNYTLNDKLIWEYKVKDEFYGSVVSIGTQISYKIKGKNTLYNFIDLQALYGVEKGYFSYELKNFFRFQFQVYYREKGDQNPTRIASNSLPSANQLEKKLLDNFEGKIRKSGSWVPW